MIKNYFTVALRNVLKHKFFSLINILGLTIGMTSCLFIYIYIADELSFDTFHTNYENIYRVGLEGKIGTQELNVTTSSYPVAAAMQQSIPGIEQTVRLWAASGVVFKYNDKTFTENDLFYADSTFLEFFSFKLLRGDIKTALLEPNSIVLTPQMSNKYFGNQDPMGQLITVGSREKAMKVTGIIEPAPKNSHLQFNGLISFVTANDVLFQGWTGNSLLTYVRKTPNTSIDEVNKKLDDLVAANVGPELEQGLGISYTDFKKNGGKYAYYIYPMTDTRLYSTMRQDQFPNSDVMYVYIFGFVGTFILIIACINFMNLSTARSAGRAKEVGLRKALGSLRGQLMGQFLSESLFYSLVAIVLAVAACYLLLPGFNLLAGKQLGFSALSNNAFLGSAVLLIVLVGVLAGSYPAFYLTAFSPTEVLKGKVKAGMKSKGVRSTLVIVQFFISILLIISTAIIFQQLDYMQNRNLGLDRQSVLNLQHLNRLGANQNAFKTELLKQSGLAHAAFTNNLLPGQNNTTVFREKGNDKDYLFETYYTDHDYLNVLKLELKEGRYFSNNAADTATVVLNEAAAREFGWTENIVGREIVNYNGPTPATIRVVGVVKDFAFESLKDKVRPLILQYSPELRFMMIRYTGSPQEAIDKLQALWKNFAPGIPFEYSFLDDNFDKLFRSEQRLKNIATVFTGLAIFVACLGLFALAAFTTEQRTKEIGIRKALGASVGRLTYILSWEFTVLVLLAFVPAALCAWYLTSQWLTGFAYRTEVSPLLFILGGIASLAVAWLTVAFQALKAARSNPVDSLRYE